MSSSKKIIFLIITAGVVVRIFLFIHFLKEPQFFYDDDSYNYTQVAENLRLGNGFSWHKEAPFKPEGFRTPAYPLFLLGHRVVFGSYNSALITQILLIAITAYLIYVIARDFANRPKTGLLTAALVLFSPFSLMVSLNFLTQTLFTFILTLAVWTWLKFLKTSLNKYFFYSAILLPLSALIRPIAFLILIPFFASFFVHAFLNKNPNFSWQRGVRLLCMAITLFIIILSPWLLRNYRVFNSFSLSTIKYYQLYFYDLPPIYGRAKGITNQEASQILTEEFHNITGIADRSSTHEYARDFAYSKLLKERFLRYLAQMPGAALITRLDFMFKFFIRDGIRYWIHYYTNGSINGLLLIPVILERGFLFLVFVGMLIFTVQSFLIKNRNTFPFFSLLFLVILYFGFLTGIMASAGLRFPVEPLFLLLGLSGLDMARKWTFDTL